MAAIAARVAHAVVHAGVHDDHPQPVSTGAEPAARMAAIALEATPGADAHTAQTLASAGRSLLDIAADCEETSDYIDEAVSLLLRNLREGMEVRLAAASDHIVRRLLDAITPVAGRQAEIAAVRARISSLVRAERHDDAWRLMRAASRLCHRANLRDDLQEHDRTWMRGRVANDVATHARPRAT